MENLTGWELFEALKPVTEANRILLWGPPGTGKTTTACLSGDIVYNVTVTDQTPFAEFRGHYLPKGSEFVWHHGTGVRWWQRQDSLLVVNEIDQASDDCLTGMRALLDDPEIAFMTLPNGETVHPSGGQRCIATMNVAPEELPEPLKDRFPVSIFVDEPHPSALQALPEDLRTAAKESCKCAPERRVTLRGWFYFARLRERMGAAVAAQAIFQHRASEILDALSIASVR